MKTLTTEEAIKTMVRILENVAQFCEDNDIKYYLGFGTMLGAVRHQGMIPWDYDIDIIMPRKDYVRFIELFSKENQNQELEVISRRINKQYKGKIARVRNTNTLNLVKKNMGQYDNEKCLCIEIYPIDGCSENKCVQTVHRYKMAALAFLYKVKIARTDSKRVWYKNLLIRLVKGILCGISIDYIIDKLESVASTYDLEKSKLLTIGGGDNGYLKRIPIEKSILDNVVNAMYEGREYPIVAEYDKWLRQIYGDYMKFPSEESIARSLKCRESYKYAQVISD